MRFAKDAPKKPEDAFEVVRLAGAELEGAQEAFLYALGLWRWLNGRA